MHAGNRNRNKISPRPEKILFWKKIFYKKTRIMPPLLLSATLLLTGCAPEEKTLLLSLETTSEEETEHTDSARDFTVKKIYTYAYETRSELEKSAFLQGCGANEIHIIALENTDGKEKLSYRQVDYRYGFYDTVGEFLQTWENWNNPDGGTIESDLYIDQLLPSPDGKQLLVYIRSAFWDGLMVRLYTLGEQELLLYEGTMPTDYPLQGSFSPNGRWVTFDTAGFSTGGTNLVPVYDCLKQPGTREASPWQILSTDSLLTPPDQVLHTDLTFPVWFWVAALCDTDGRAGLVNLFQEQGDSSLSVTRITPSMPLVVPEDYLVSEKGKKIVKNYQYQSSYLHGQKEMPYLLYEISDDGNRIDYLETPRKLNNIDLDTFSSRYQPIEFPGIVWDFKRLDSGDLLVVLAQDPDQEAAYFGTEGKNVSGQPYPDSDDAHAITQGTWGIQSADLYLYPLDGTEGQLLYKNLQNLLRMEYDEQNSRILLETYEGSDLTHRKCILLEL